jgi:N utilization substance protein A
MELREIKAAISQISEERGIPFEKVLETFEQALASAYKKEYGKKGQQIGAKIDLETGEVKFWQTKTVIDEKEVKEGKIKFNPERQILLEEARKIKPNVKEGEELTIPLEVKKNYGRIAAQTAKQVILQKLKEVERELVFQEYKSKEGQIISGIVQRVEPKLVYLNIGKTTGILPKEEQVQGEFYRPGQRLKVYILKVEQTPKGASVILSRSHPKLVSRLFELEVPEIQAGQLEIKSIAREAGSRTKIAVASKVKEIDPIGAMVGHRGTRVGAVINELGGEKIDIVLYSEKPEEYIANSFSPAKVLEVKILPKNKALVIVPDDQLSLAIGKDGQNVRLVAKLTNWKIDVKSKSEVEKEEKTS